MFSTITGQMNLSDEVDLEDYVARPDKISGADINSICQEVQYLDLIYWLTDWDQLESIEICC